MKKKKYPYIVLSIIGILTITISFFIKPKSISNDEFIYSVFLNIGFIILTIVIVNFLWFILGGEPLEEIVHQSIKNFQLAADGYTGGLDRAFSSSSGFANSEEWIKMLSKAKHSIDLMGYSLCMLTLTNEFSNVLSSLANRGVNIRILIMDYENSFFEAGLNFEGIPSMTRISMKEEIIACERCVNHAKSNVKKNKEKNIKFVKIKKGLSECQIIRIDNNIYVTPYLYFQHTSDSPLFVVRKQDNGYYNKYLSEFENLWNTNV